MKIRLCLACTRKVRQMLEMTLLPECQTKFSCCRADQKQIKSKNLHIFLFGVDVTICMYLPPPYITFFSRILGTPISTPTPYLVDVIFEWPPKGETSFHQI